MRPFLLLTAAITAGALSVTSLTHPAETVTTPTPSAAASSTPIRLGTIGDSISAFTDRSGTPTGFSWVRAALDQGGLTDAGGYKHWGDTTAQMVTGHTPVTADVLVVMAGTNDIYDGITMTPTNTTLTNITHLFNRSAMQIGVLSALAPKNGAGAAPTLTLNTHLKTLATQNGWVFLDPWTPVRATDGQWQPGTTNDGVHPTPEVGTTVGTTMREHILNLYPGGTRLAGDTAYDTAAAASAATFAPGVPVAYLASRSGFADALAAGPAAGRNHGPILLLYPDGTIPTPIATELTRLTPDRIVILGGTNVIPATTHTALTTYTTGTVTRLAGNDRYATSAAISHATFPPNTPTAYIATGNTFPDALSAATAAAATPTAGPVLLTAKNELPNTIKTELTRLNPTHIIVIGGTDAITTTITTELHHYSTHITRISGTDRYTTSTAISHTTHPNGADTVYIANGNDYPDALSTAPIAGTNHAPLLLTAPNEIPTTLTTELTRLNPHTIIIIGGPNAITPTTAHQLATYTTHTGSDD